MSYEVFARKYRPKVFDDLVGQEAVAQALRYAVAAGRTASVYLFAGSHGVGKTSVARILAKALNCPQVKDGNPCGTCETCESIARGECLDVVEIDAASNSKVDDVRTLRESVGYKPASCRFKVYILDEVHRLSTNAFDALLKTFEESPPLVRFVLATTELHKVPTTILSRSQVFRFQRAGLDALVQRLRAISTAEGLSVDDAALRTIARRARGSIRDSQKLLDQVAALAGASGASGAARSITSNDVAFLLGDASVDVVARCLVAINDGQSGVLLGEVHGFIQQGGRADALATDLLEALRGALYLKTAGPTSPLLEDVALLPEDLRAISESLSEEGLLYALQLLQDAQTKMRDAREPRLVLELALVRLARARELRPVGEVLARLERIERALGPAGATPAASRAAPPAAPPARPAAPAAAPVVSQPRAPEPAPRAPEPRAPEPRSPGSPPRARSGYDYPAALAPPPGLATVAVSGAPGSTSRSAQAAAAPNVSATSATALADPPRAALALAPAALAPTALAPAAVRAPVAEPAPAASSPVSSAASLPPPEASGALAPFVAAWDRVRAAASAKNVMLGRALDRSKPLAFHGSVLVVEVRTSDLIWGQLQDQSPRAAEIVREVVGAPAASVELRFERARDVVAPAPAGPAPGRAPASGSVYEEPIVHTAQRVLGSQQLGGGW